MRKLFAPGGSRVLQSSGLLEANSLFESKKEDKVAIGDLRHLETSITESQSLILLKTGKGWHYPQ